MLVRKSLAAAGATAVALLGVGSAAPASAAESVSGGFADAKGIIVDLTVLTQIGLPGPLGGTPIDPNTFSTASQSCPPNAGKPAEGAFPGNVDAAPAATAATLNTMAGANCAGPSAVASAQTEGLKALFNAGVPLITADVIRAQANSDCTKAPNAAGTVITGLSIAGQAIPDPLAQPNRRIEIPGVATVIINEQNPTADGRGIVVNGLHIIGASPLLKGDLIISHAVSGVVCDPADGGPGSDFTGVNGAKPTITFDKDATPSTANAGDTVTYNATVRNVSTAPCEVRRFIDHLDPAFDFVSTDGAFGKTPVTPAPLRGDKGVEVILNPTGLTIAPGASVKQTFVVKLKGDVKPGTYYNNLEIFCLVNGNFASGPLAPVTVPAPVVAPPVVAPPAPVPQELPRTGSAPFVAGAALLLLAGAAGVARSARV